MYLLGKYALVADQAKKRNGEGERFRFGRDREGGLAIIFGRLHLKRLGEEVKPPEAKRTNGTTDTGRLIPLTHEVRQSTDKQVKVVRRSRVSKKKLEKGTINLVEENLMEVSVVYQESSETRGEEVAFNNPQPSQCE
ncbi:hypothetical protein Dimus_019056 [Dionaea muscipula]